MYIFINMYDMDSRAVWNQQWSNWQSLHSSFQSYDSHKSKELQYKILNKHLATNSFLKKIGLSENDQFMFCEQKSEDLHHLFYECSIVNNCCWTLILFLVASVFIVANTPNI